MAKFEITNPEAIKLIEDIKSGVYFKPIIEKIKKIKWILIGAAVFIVLLIFFAVGKSLSRNIDQTGYVPPSLDIERTVTPTTTQSKYNSLKEEIYLFSTELPDPVIPDLNNNIDLKPETF